MILYKEGKERKEQNCLIEENERKGWYFANEEKEGKDTESSETKKVNISENSSDTSSSSSDSTKKITL